MFASLSGLLIMLVQALSFVSPAGFLSPGPSPAPAATSAPTASTEAVCPAATSTQATCLSWVRALSGHQFKTAATAKALPAGYGPAQFRSAYGVTASGTGSLAVITAYDNPRLASDLATYDQTYGLPVFPTCITATQTGCFTKVSQTGSSTLLPLANRSWAVEADLDVELAHSMCPSCRLTSVEANSATIPNLMTAVDRAVTIGAHVVSMSWGTSEFSTETTYDSHFTNPNVNFVAAAGDSGYATGWPAASNHVLAAGGTHLTLTTAGARATETVWSGTGSGCSLYETKPAYQTDTGCTKRTMNDVAADADPNTGAAIYSGYSPYGAGWLEIGGTSLATPLIAGMVSDSAAQTQSALLAKLYSPTASASLFDVTSGTNGHCAVSYLCTAGTTYDAPTGLGAPIGLGAL